MDTLDVVQESVFPCEKSAKGRGGGLVYRVAGKSWPAPLE